MDKNQLQTERARLQAVLDRYNALEPEAGRHAGLAERIANLDRRIGRAPAPAEVHIVHQPDAPNSDNSGD